MKLQLNYINNVEAGAGYYFNGTIAIVCLLGRKLVMKQVKLERRRSGVARACVLGEKAAGGRLALG